MRNINVEREDRQFFLPIAAVLNLAIFLYSTQTTHHPEKAYTPEKNADGKFFQSTGPGDPGNLWKGC